MTANIILSMSEVIYDIQNKTYLTGRAREDGDNHRQVANMQANNDDPDLNQLLRSVQTALGNLSIEFSRWLPDSGDEFSNTDLPDAGQEVEFKMELPSNFNPAALRSLADASHQYVVALAVAEWFAITDKADAQQYASAAEEALSAVRRCLSRRVRPVRRPLPPI